MTLEERVSLIEVKLGLNQLDMRECWGDVPEPEVNPLDKLLDKLNNLESDLADTIENKYNIERDLKKRLEVMTEKYNKSVSYSQDLLIQREYWSGLFDKYQEN